MSNSRTLGRSTIAAFALLLASCGAAFAEQPRVVVRLYDTVTEDAGARAAAMHVTGAILEDAGIAVDWRDCSRNGDAHPCRTVRGERDLVVRIMPAYVPRPASDAARASLKSRDESSRPDVQLGFAAVDPERRTAVMATMFHDRIITVARRAGLDYSSVLGRAMAHEIGHLLLMVEGHGTSGLMRAIWTDAELIQGRRDDWTFSARERRLLEASFVDADAPTLPQAARTTLP
jgi:hypothetical protein